ncbi:MAG: phosphoribosylaminoimidazolesuccinocarboxamide synthase [Pseudomonadota bacterium]|nr:phosphoribosylaminoimidazolesuccinocarboxamide synthase [Pseudomonadota bacterium]
MQTSYPAILESDIRSLPLLARGKVRDVYAVDEQHLLLVTTDRLSAFDVVFPTPIPGKGRILNTLSNFWFEKLGHLVPNHLTGIDPESVVAERERDQVRDRAVVVRRLKALPLEAVARGYLEGSGWKEYQDHGTVCGITLPAGLVRADRLPQPIFTPATKAAVGDHDENIDFARACALVGTALATQVRDTTLALYEAAAEFALGRGIIIADTKFEFGTDAQGDLVWIDEALTPDSSRFWPRASYRPGSSPESFDKQFLRNWLEASGWDKQPPAPALPDEIALGTAARYQEALDRLTA